MMRRKLIFSASFIFILILAGTASADLIGYWTFNEGSGNIAADSSGNGREGTLEGGPNWVAGHLAGALEFDGSDDYVTAGENFLSNLGQFTIAFWVAGDPSGASRTGLVGQNDCVEFGFISSNTIQIWTPGGGSLDVTWPYSDLGFHHIAAVGDGTSLVVYLDGAEAGRGGSGTNSYGSSTFSVNIGGGGVYDGSGNWFTGKIDDVQIYNHALTGEEVQIIMLGLGEYPYASSPNPKDGAVHLETWVSLGWRAGDSAVSHDVYMGENFDDVNDATRDSDVFQGNQGLGFEFFIAGFAGYPYPDGLVNGTTYYWRIDEVNEADPNSPWKGDIWSFTVPPKTAYNPIPASGAKFVEIEDAALSWTAGFGSKLHFVYFGDDYDTVANAAGAPPTAFTTYSPGSLEIEKTYYWRVDESDGTNMLTGDVWSFTTAKEGGGLKGEYFNNNSLNGAPVITRVDPEVDFNWGNATVPGENSPDPSIGVDNFSARWTGELEVDLTDAYTFEINANNGFRLWLDGQLIVDYWDNPTTSTRKSEPIELVGGATYSIQMDYFEGEDMAIAQLFWASSTREMQIVPQAALSPPIKANSPFPVNGATGTKMSPVLRWNAGDYAASHEVYFGTEKDAVMNATTASPEYKGSKALGDESYDPGKLAWHTAYYWRIDEVNNIHPDSPWTGNVWSFTTGDFLLVDNFEGYDSGDNQIWSFWHDGLGYGAIGTQDFFAGNGTGSAVGDETTASFTEETIVHGDRQAMPVSYDNNQQGFAKYSEVELTLTDPRDWTEEGVAELSLWFRGYPPSVGSFTEGPVGTYTMTGSGEDIWDVGSAGEYHDEFHYAYKTLAGAGTIVAKVESISDTHDWAKAGVMIRESLNADSRHAMMIVSSAAGVSFQRRPDTGGASAADTTADIAAPYWVKIERDLAGNFSAYSSVDSTSWQKLGMSEPIQMATNVYIGLAVTSHDAALTCQAVFSNVTTTGMVGQQWANQDIGIESNDPEPLYVAVSNSNGTPAVVVHDDPDAATIDTWTEWIIPLQELADQGIILTDIDKIAIGMGTKGNMTIPGGSGKMIIDDIRLYRLEPEQQP